jgi:hypothetical protein
MPLVWTTVQTIADALLAQGVFALRNGPRAYPADVATTDPGNYLISLDGRPLYVGEGGDLSARLHQQFHLRTSTFYKNYLRSGDSNAAPITAFGLQYMTIRIGRKEIEDFGIANIPAPLNRFQLDKRAVRAPANGAEDWARVQAMSADLLAQAEERFWSLRPAPMPGAVAPDRPGIYALWGGSPRRVIYIGESSGLRDRHKTHCTQTYFSALRRNVGTNLLGFELHEKKGKRRYFTNDEERSLNAFLGQCLFQCMEVTIGRIELEERLIGHEMPAANRKGTGRTTVVA